MCFDERLMRWLRYSLSENTSTFNKLHKLNLSKACYTHESHSNESLNSSSLFHFPNPSDHVQVVGLDIFAYVTPFIIIVGLTGNSIALKIFCSRAMRKMSASLYLAALAASDNAVLLTYVFFDWLQRGLSRWPPGHYVNVLGNHGICQFYLFVSYSFRFLSAWLIVIFTIERYIGICRPLQRRVICSGAFAKRAIFLLVGMSFTLSLYKPLVSKVVLTNQGAICGSNGKYEYLNFVLDAIYGALITGLPFTVIGSLNCLIMRTFMRTRMRHKKTHFLSQENVIKLEFTVILLIVSTSFVLLNLPFFIVWCHRFQQQARDAHHLIDPTAHERLRGYLYVTKTIFFLNYCVNFFLYSLTGPHFRRQVRKLITGKVSIRSLRRRAAQEMMLNPHHTSKETSQTTNPHTVAVYVPYQATALQSPTESDKMLVVDVQYDRNNI